MSHAATHWLASLDPARMSHGEFRVLFHLCDCHNASMGCFPAQAYLRAHTGLSNAGLNKALRSLEDKALIRREQNRDSRTHRQKATRYILGFEIEPPQEPTPLSGDGNSPSRLHPGGDGADSTHDATRLHSEDEPTPLSGVAYKDEPVKEPGKEPCAASAQPKDHDLDDLEARFAEAYPRASTPAKVRKALEAALAEGAEPEQLIAAARAYAEEQRGNHARYIAYPENWLAQRRWQNGVKAAPGPDPNARLKGAVGLVKSGLPHLARHVTAVQAREMLHRGLVTEDECRAAEVQW
jgi:hypothetical protein